MGPILFFAFFIVCTEVNEYIDMGYSLKTGDSFMNKKLGNGLINNSCKNDSTCESPKNIRKRQISHILETVPTHATE